MSWGHRDGFCTRLGGVGLLACAVISLPVSTWAQSFVNWENAHVHPLDLTPDGQSLLAVNTADNRLEERHPWRPEC